MHDFQSIFFIIVEKIMEIGGQCFWSRSIKQFMSHSH